MLTSFDFSEWFNRIDLLMTSFSTIFYILQKIYENFKEISSFFEEFTITSA